MGRADNVAIVTADFGPDRQATAMRIENVKSINFDFEKGMVTIPNGIHVAEFAYTGVATVTFSISNGVTTVTIA